MSEPRFRIVDMNSVEPLPCPCGSARRAFTDDPDKVCSFHVVDISADARTHYHKAHTEVYYILEGDGQLELDGELFDVHPGMSILIKPGCRHRAIGNLKIINVSTPTFDPQDEWFD